MRVTFATVNRNVQNNLSRRYADMVGLQEQLATGKRLRKPSDDPIDVANVVKLRTKHTQLRQYKRNIEDGLAMMGVASSAMTSMNDLLHRARELAVQAANGTYTDRDRMYMQQEVDQIFRQMMSVINTQFKGNHIFNGTNTKTPPYIIETSGSDLPDYNARTMATYGRELEWSLRSGDDPLHHDVTDTIFLNYSSSQLRVGDTVQLTWGSADPALNNTTLTNVFPETLPLDTYDVNGFTYENGFDYAVDYRTGQVSILSERFRDALNSMHLDPAVNTRDATAIGHNIFSGAATGTVLQYSTENTFQILEGKVPGDAITNIFPGSFRIKIGDREYIEGFGEYKGGFYDEEGVYHKGANEFDFSVDYENGRITIYNMDLLRDMRPGWLIPDDDGNLNPSAPAGDMYRPGQLQLDFDYITRGTNIYGDKVTSQGQIFRAIEEGITAPINIRADAMLRDSRTGFDMVGVFMRYSQALLKDDREGIQNALTELNSMYDAVLNSQSEIGAKIYRFELTLKRNGEQTVEVMSQKSALEDADLAEVISKLLLAENVYNAALQAAMRVIQPSLANFM